MNFNAYGCPMCKSLLMEEENTFFCTKCDLSYSIENGIPNFGQETFYWNQVSQAVMGKILEDSETIGWKEALIR